MNLYKMMLTKFEERSTDDDILLKANTIHEIKCVSSLLFSPSASPFSSLDLFSTHFKLAYTWACWKFGIHNTQCCLFFIYRRYLAKHLKLIDDNVTSQDTHIHVHSVQNNTENTETWNRNTLQPFATCPCFRSFPCQVNFLKIYS